MAKATFTYKCARCGGTFEISRKFGSRKEADQWEAWAEDSSPYNECPECFRLRKQQERKAADIAAAEKSKGEGFPDLTGSEKQIAWASKIRQDFIDEYFPWDKLTDEGREFMIRFLNENNSARYWIDNRDKCAGLYIKIGKLYQQTHPETKNTD